MTAVGKPYTLESTQIENEPSVCAIWAYRSQPEPSRGSFLCRAVAIVKLLTENILSKNEMIMIIFSALDV